MSQSLYRKWRPKRWEEIVGQEAVVRTLQQAVRSGRVAHAYLFAGPRGTGKTTTARILAKALNCLDPDPEKRPCTVCSVCQEVQEGRFLDLIEIDAASHTGVDDVRALRDRVHFAPTKGRYKVYIIDEVHMLSTAAFNALLKTLEEPPSHVIFVLATTEWHKVPATVRSRCQVYPFRRIPLKDILAYLRRIVDAEGIAIEEDALRAIARQATGSLRDAISLLDQLASLGEAVTLEHVHALLGTAPDEAVYTLVEALRQGDGETALRAMHQALQSGTDPRVLARQVVDYLRQVMLVQMGVPELLEVSDVWRRRAQDHAQQLPIGTLSQWIRLFQRAATTIGVAWYPALPLEMALVEALYGAASEEAPRPKLAARVEPAAGPGPSSSSPTTSEPSPSGEAQSLSFDQVQRAWPRVMRWLEAESGSRGAPDLPGLARHVQLLEARENTVVLRVSSNFWRRRFEKEPYRTLWHQAWQAALGRDVTLEWLVLSEKTGKISSSDLPPLVATAVQLGGQIREFIPRPGTEEQEK